MSLQPPPLIRRGGEEGGYFFSPFPPYWFMKFMIIETSKRLSIATTIKSIFSSASTFELPIKTIHWVLFSPFFNETHHKNSRRLVNTCIHPHTHHHSSYNIMPCLLKRISIHGPLKYTPRSNHIPKSFWLDQFKGLY
jgi:hypothetical protein